jgi:hypothetical protein
VFFALLLYARPIKLLGFDQSAQLIDLAQWIQQPPIPIAGAGHNRFVQVDTWADGQRRRCAGKIRCSAREKSLEQDLAVAKATVTTQEAVMAGML